MMYSRVNRSTRFSNNQVLNPPPAATSDFQWNPRVNPSVISAHAPPPKAGEMERVGILTVSSTEVALGNGQWSHFLDKCFSCKKGMSVGDELFMYGDFRAFCSPDCRAKQIVVDSEKGNASKKSTGTKTERRRKSELKYRSGVLLEKHAF